MPGFDVDRIVQLEERLSHADGPRVAPALPDLEMLADLYLQADHYTPALRTIESILARPEAEVLSAARRAGLLSKSVTCLLLKGDAQGALAQTRDILSREAAIEPVGLRCRLHLQCAEALFTLGRLDDCDAETRKGLGLADASTDLSLTAWALNLAGRVQYRRGDLDGARDFYEQALALYRRLRDDLGTAHIRNNLGLIHKNLCEWEAAAAHLQASLEIQRRLGRYGETLAPLLNLGIVAQKSGDWARAAQWYAEAQQVCVHLNDDLRWILVAIGLGNLARLEGRFEDAEAQLTRALDRAREKDARREETLALEFLGELDFDRGHPEEAATRYQIALQLAERITPEGDLVVEIERRRAEALLALGRLDAAESSCQRASRLARQTDDRLEFAVAERVSGSIAWARGHAQDAFVSWKLAASLLEAAHEHLELGKTYLEMGRAADVPATARQYYYRACAVFAPLSSPRWLERVDEELRRVMEPAPTLVRAPSAGRRHRAPGLVACSPSMRQVESLAHRAAGTELSCLILGETGTGKELIARTIHSLSSRKDQPFLAVNCGALRADLALSQLFGHRKGAFTGAHADGVGLVEAAHGGTLFLDEVGELPLDVQVTMLRFLESGEYMRLGETQVRRADVRIIAATNRLLRGSDDRFRRDLLFRLDEIEIRVPALRERREDVVALARHFVAFYGGLDGPRLSGDAESMLLSYPWPGNVRELENVMKRVAALHGGQSLVTASSLVPFLSSDSTPMADASASNGRNGARPDPREERASILDAYARARGNKSRVAEMLGVSRKTLYARLKRLDLQLP